MTWSRFLYFGRPHGSITCPGSWRGRDTLLRLGLLDEALLSWQDIELHVRAIAAGCRYLRFPEIDHHVRWQFEPTKVSGRAALRCPAAPRRRHRRRSRRLESHVRLRSRHELGAPARALQPLFLSSPRLGWSGDLETRPRCMATHPQPRRSVTCRAASGRRAAAAAQADRPARPKRRSANGRKLGAAAEPARRSCRREPRTIHPAPACRRRDGRRRRPGRSAAARSGSRR